MINFERGPTNSGRVEMKVMTGREGLRIGRTSSGNLLGQQVAIIIRQGLTKQGYMSIELLC